MLGLCYRYSKEELGPAEQTQHSLTSETEALSLPSIGVLRILELQLLCLRTVTISPWKLGYAGHKAPSGTDRTTKKVDIHTKLKRSACCMSAVEAAGVKMDGMTRHTERESRRQRTKR